MSNTKISKIIIDREKCIGAATCVVLAPNAFELDSQGVAVLKDSYTSHSDEDIIKAVLSCPTQAIKAFDSEGAEIKTL